MKNVIFRATVLLYQWRWARLIGFLMLLVVAFLALTTSGLLTAKEVTGPGNPALATPLPPPYSCDCAGGPPQAFF